MAIPQTSYSLDQAAGLPGMPCSADPGQLITGEFVASEDILPGLMVEIDPSDTTVKKCRLPQTASAAGKLLGVAMYRSSDQVGSWKAGDTVRVLQRGEIFAYFTGTAGSDLWTQLKVRSASDNSNSEATHRGKFTDASTSTTVGQEVYQTTAICREETSVSPTGLCKVYLDGGLLK